MQFDHDREDIDPSSGDFHWLFSATPLVAMADSRRGCNCLGGERGILKRRGNSGLLGGPASVGAEDLLNLRES